MARAAVLVACLIPLAASQFLPPDAILQAGYPAGFRAFIPDFPGCERFGFYGKLNSPFTGDEKGMFSANILRPQGDFWVFEDLNAVLTPGDILHYWTLVVKDKVDYPKKNLTWRVPDPDESVDLLAPITLKPPTDRPTPEKTRDTEPTTPTEEATTPSVETTPSDEASPTPSSEPIESSSASPTKPSSTTATPTTTKAPTTTTKKPPTTKPKKSTSSNPLMAEEVEELPTPGPTLPFDRPITSEFPEEPPSLFPFPSLFPTPFKPMMPPSGPGFEICSNPWNFEERPGESRTQRLERQVAKLQCELALFQRSFTRLGNTVQNELSDLKKLVYGMVSRMGRLELVLRSAAFG